MTLCIMERTSKILHYLSMEGLADTETIAEGLDLSNDEIDDTLSELEADGFVKNEGFWYLTDDGEGYLNDLLRERFTAEQLDELEARYADFESFDLAFKDLANAWQGTEVDAKREELIEELSEFHGEVRSFFDEFSEPIHSKYKRYIDDLDAALQKLRDGEEDYYTGTEVNSYHTVWFRLHDDLLRTLGKEREE